MKYAFFAAYHGEIAVGHERNHRNFLFDAVALYAFRIFFLVAADDQPQSVTEPHAVFSEFAHKVEHHDERSLIVRNTSAVKRVFVLAERKRFVGRGHDVEMAKNADNRRVRIAVIGKP